MIWFPNWDDEEKKEEVRTKGKIDVKVEVKLEVFDLKNGKLEKRK
jgi:hypothetical protein